MTTDSAKSILTRRMKKPILYTHPNDVIAVKLSFGCLHKVFQITQILIINCVVKLNLNLFIYFILEHFYYFSYIKFFIIVNVID